MRNARRLQAVIFDWAGTTVDQGSLAPVAALQELFRRRGVALSAATARGPMGIHKRAHIEALCALPEVAEAFEARAGHRPGPADVDAMFAELVPLQLALLPDHAEPVIGCCEAIAALRARGLRIGSTTGYTRAMMDVLAPAARERGFAPDFIVTADEVARSRPFPDMCLKNMAAFGIRDPLACVKVDDTPVGIEEGRRAGMWTVGVVMTGNEVGRSLAELESMRPEERARLRAEGILRLAGAGAHWVIDGIADLPRVIASIEAELRRPAAA
ncbi:MAG: phosphonoacetaldehyde hydrolase [Byssovorax sp.]